MPPRYSYWTIVAGGLPTAFRAAVRADLLPTFTRLREKHPDAEMKWFARGRLWDSPEAARAELKKIVARHRDWRPGGEHRDPRQKFKDAKQARNREWREQKFARKSGRRFEPRRFPWSQGTEEPTPPPRPRGPNREPRPSESPEPTPPPRPSEPAIPPPPPERGNKRKRRP